MNKQKFIELLRKPAEINKEDISGLESTLKQYPYFQSAHLLLAKGSRLIKDPNTKKRISSAAVYCTDRNLLKKYISGDMIYLDSVNKPPINVEEELPAKEVKNFRKPNKPERKAEADQPGEQSIIPEDKVAAAPVKDSNFNPDSILDEIKSGLEAYKENKKHFEEYLQSDETEETASNEDVTDESVYEKEVDSGNEENTATTDENGREVETDDEEVALGEEIIHTEANMPVEDEMEFDISGIIAEIKKDEELSQREKDQSGTTPEDNSDLTDEVPSESEDNTPETDQAKPEKPVATPTESEKEPAKTQKSAKVVIAGSNRSRKKSKKAGKEDLPKPEEKQVENKLETEKTEEKSHPASSADQEEDPAVGRDTEHDSNEDENLSPGALRKAKMKRLKLQKDIIDDFIDTTAQMSTPPRPKPQENPEREDLSADSQKVEEEIVSENMAIIYKNQGKTQKAIGIYNKLILKFPEKEAYFAARIKELNK